MKNIYNAWDVVVMVVYTIGLLVSMISIASWTHAECVELYDIFGFTSNMVFIMVLTTFALGFYFMVVLGLMENEG